MLDLKTTGLQAQVISVIVPCRNERDHIDVFCASVLEQKIPEGWTIEVLIADGKSDDGTRERLSHWVQEDPRFVLIDNPGRIVSTGLNRCIERAKGRFIVRLDVHTVYAHDYIEQCLSAWQRTGADNVGGPWRAMGMPGQKVQQAIAAAFQSKWVSGGAMSRDLEYEGEVDTVYLGAWPRETFERFGGFDEKLVRNQDDEHNLRIHKGGGRIWQSAKIRSTYYPRASVSDVFRQYRQYGYWKPFVMKKHGQAAALRHLIPGLFVAAVASLLMLMLVFGGLTLVARTTSDLKWVSAWGCAITSITLMALLLTYGLAVGLVSFSISRSLQGRLLGQLPDVIAAYHFGYGLGSIRGWWDALVKGKPDPAFGRLTRGRRDQRGG